ncbi:hypothetical protein QR685DRAFT_514176 [Neurospora intermedia]|uniref:Uncharacterized protein n=1 Tax=Neurospora intermedia TaxID=5142 RepID=A0ABR3DTK0_NEUIN
MSNTIELPTDLETSLALKFIPIIELQENFSNFEEWEHSIRFCLRYHNLLQFIEGKQTSTSSYYEYGYDPEDEGRRNDPTLHRRLLVYSLIWKSAVAIFRQSPFSKDLEDELYKNRDHEPKKLWNLLHTHIQSIRNPKPVAPPKTGKSSRK